MTTEPRSSAGQYCQASVQDHRVTTQHVTQATMGTGGWSVTSDLSEGIRDQGLYLSALALDRALPGRARVALLGRGSEPKRPMASARRGGGAWLWSPQLMLIGVAGDLVSCPFPHTPTEQPVDMEQCRSGGGFWIHLLGARSDACNSWHATRITPIVSWRKGGSGRCGRPRAGVSKDD